MPAAYVIIGLVGTILNVAFWAWLIWFCLKKSEKREARRQTAMADLINQKAAVGGLSNQPTEVIRPADDVV